MVQWLGEWFQPLQTGRLISLYLHLRTMRQFVAIYIPDYSYAAVIFMISNVVSIQGARIYIQADSLVNAAGMICPPAIVHRCAQ